MQIMDVDQNTQEWLEARKGRITGSAGNGQLSAKHGVAFWDMLADLISEPSTGEDPRERGHELENINAELTVKAHDLDNPLYETKFWISDKNPMIAVSPDCHEDSDSPTWAVECKSLGAPNHLAAVVPIVLAQEKKLAVLHMRKTNVLEFLPLQYRFQALQYFVVCESLRDLYFSFYNPEIKLEKYQRADVDIRRVDVQKYIDAQSADEMETIEAVKQIEEMGGDESIAF